MHSTWALFSTLLVGIGLGLLAPFMVRGLQCLMTSLVATRHRRVARHALRQTSDHEVWLKQYERRFAPKTLDLDLTLHAEETAAVAARLPRENTLKETS